MVDGTICADLLCIVVICNFILAKENITFYMIEIARVNGKSWMILLQLNY